jgi:glycosyltransferase involved in cell wall biosynthesis
VGKQLRVAMLGAYPLDATRINGGVQAAFTYLVRGLAQIDDLDLHILTFKPSDYSGKDQIKEANLTLHLLPEYPHFERLRNYRTYQTIVNTYLTQLRPNLIHAQDAGSDALVALRSDFPSVITVHGIRWEDGRHYSSWVKRLRVYYDSLLTERYVIRHARHLIAISTYITSYFKEMMRPDIEIYCVPNAIDERYFNLEPSPDEQIILFAGRVIPRKRVMELVHAFAQVHSQVPSARLRIAGEISTEPAYVESIRKWLHESNLAEHVMFLGPLPEESVLWEFAGCSLLVLPSAQESAPMVIAQAMAARKPVVATRVGGVAEMVGEQGERGFLVGVEDSDGLATSMLRLLKDADLRVRMGQNGYAFARENFHSENVARRTSEVYHHIVGKARQSNA